MCIDTTQLYFILDPAFSIDILNGIDVLNKTIRIASSYEKFAGEHSSAKTFVQIWNLFLQKYFEEHSFKGRFENEATDCPRKKIRKCSYMRFAGVVENQHTLDSVRDNGSA